MAGSGHHSSRPLRVVLIGAESTGKSTLAAQLAKRYKTVWAPEFLRQFVCAKGGLPEEKDVYAIAHGHLEQEAHLLPQAKHVLFLDTDLINTCVYQRIYFETCPGWVEDNAIAHRGDLYIFTEPDIPWEPDPGQREGPEARLRTHALLLEEARHLDLNFVSVHGTMEARLEQATRAIDLALEHRST